MESDVQWFAHFCLENAIFDKAACQTLFDQLGEDVSLQDFIDAVSAQGSIEDPDFLQELIDKAWSNGQEGEAPPSLDLGVSAVPEAPKASTVPASAEMPDFASLDGLDEEGFKTALKNIFTACQNMGASDLHITAEARPRVRLHRSIEYLSETPLSASIAERLNLAFLSQEKRDLFKEEKDLDYALAFGEQQRIRINLMVAKDGISGVYHFVPNRVQTLEELGFHNADIIKGLLAYHNGIILVTGPVGAGKTTTLATLIDELNRTRSDHVITVEDPIEIVQESDKGIITQREVGRQTQSFANALKSALREDPDIIVIGEMRDLETIEMAITAAETGHLVIATMHTQDATSTLSRLLEVFPPSQQPQIRAMTAGSLRGVICQRLLPSVEGKLVMASELLLNATAVGNLIREGKELGLKSVMQTGKKKGMCLMDDSITDLYQSGKISKETALANISDKNLRRTLAG